MQHRIAFTTVQAEPGKPVLPAEQVNDGQKAVGGRGRRSTVWCWEWDCCILRRLWQQREIHQWGKAVQQCNCLRLSASLCGTNHVRNCNCNENWVLASACHSTYSGVCVYLSVCVCAIYLWQHQTPLTCGTHNLCLLLLLLLWATSQVPLSGTDWVSTVTGYRIQLIIFNWIRWPDLKLCLKATEIICAYKSL